MSLRACGHYSYWLVKEVYVLAAQSSLKFVPEPHVLVMRH